MAPQALLCPEASLQIKSRCSGARATAVHGLVWSCRQASKEPCIKGEWGERLPRDYAGATVECRQEHSKRSPPGSRLVRVLVQPYLLGRLKTLRIECHGQKQQATVNVL